MMARETGLEPAASAVTGQSLSSNINAWSYFYSPEKARKGQKYFYYVVTNTYVLKSATCPITTTTCCPFSWGDLTKSSGATFCRLGLLAGRAPDRFTVPWYVAVRYRGPTLCGQSDSQ